MKSIPFGIGEMFDVVKREIFRFAQCEMFSLRSNVKSSFGSRCTLTLVGEMVFARGRSKNAPTHKNIICFHQITKAFVVGGDVLDAPKIAKFSRYTK